MGFISISHICDDIICSADDGRILVWDLSKVGEQEHMVAKWLACPTDQRFAFESEEEEEQYGSPLLLDWNVSSSNKMLVSI